MHLQCANFIDRSDKTAIFFPIGPKTQTKVRELKSCCLSSFVEFRSAVSEESWKCLSQPEAQATIFLGHRSQRLQWPIVIMRCPSSVVRPSVRQFTFSTSSPESLDGFWWKLVCMKYSRSLTSVVVFRQIHPGADPGKNRSRRAPS